MIYKKSDSERALDACELSPTEALSRTVSFLRLPLIVLVVMIHMNPGVPDIKDLVNFPAANFIYDSLFKRGIASVAVPAFFFISGFFYFYGKTWGVPAWVKNTRSRVRSLAVPFFLWSVPVVAYVILVYKLGLTRSTIVAENSTSITAWAKSIFGLNYGEGSTMAFPLLGPFWFVRDLFVVSLLSPLWHLLLKNGKLGLVALFALGALWFCWQGKQIPGLSTTAIFFFCAGAYFSIHKRNFAEDFSKIAVPAIIVYTLLLTADVLTKTVPANWFIHRAQICIAIVAITAWAYRGICAGKLRANAFLAEASFFVFAAHNAGFFKSPYSKLLDYFYVPASNAELIVMFFLKTAFEVCACLAAFWLLKKIAPRLLSLLIGGR